MQRSYGYGYGFKLGLHRSPSAARRIRASSDEWLHRRQRHSSQVFRTRRCRVCSCIGRIEACGRRRALQHARRPRARPPRAARSQSQGDACTSSAAEARADDLEMAKIRSTRCGRSCSSKSRRIKMTHQNDASSIIAGLNYCRMKANEMRDATVQGRVNKARGLQHTARTSD